MKKKIEYSDAPDGLGEAIATGERVVDFLPPPDQLVFRQPKVKVTITLNRRSVDFFKRFAKTHHVKYQTMINEVLDQYATKFSGQVALQNFQDDMAGEAEKASFGSEEDVVRYLKNLRSGESP